MSREAQAHPRRGKAASIGLWVATVLVTLFFLLMGLPKVLGQGGWTAQFVGWGYPGWFATVVGVVEVAAAALLLVPSLATPAGLGLVVIMIGALATHLIHGDPFSRILSPLVFLVLAATVAWGRRGQSRLAALRAAGGKAD